MLFGADAAVQFLIAGAVVGNEGGQRRACLLALDFHLGEKFSDDGAHIRLGRRLGYRYRLHDEHRPAYVTGPDEVGQGIGCFLIPGRVVVEVATGEHYEAIGQGGAVGRIGYERAGEHVHELRGQAHQGGGSFASEGSEGNGAGGLAGQVQGGFHF